METIGCAQERPVGVGRAWAMIAVLSLLFVVSMVDRFVMGLLVEPLKRDLGVSDVQLGLLFGSAFAIFYGVITIPLARFADRGNRMRLIIFAVILWSTCTILCGFTTSFQTLVLLRIGLAIGEAALVPSTYSLIGDALPADRRTLGGAIFNVFGMAGASGAYLIGSGAIDLAEVIRNAGYWTSLREWQAVFVIVGLPGLVLVCLLALIGKEPPKTQIGAVGEVTSFADVMRFVRSHGWLYPGVLLGGGCLVLATNGFLAWTPAYLSRAYAMPMAEAGRLFGTSNLFAFVTASVVGPLIGAGIGRRRQDALVVTGMICALFSAIACLIAVLQTSWEWFLICSFIGLFFAICGASNTISTFHKLTPPDMRATLTSMLLIFLTTFALGVAPPLVGFVSGAFGSGDAALGVGLGVVSVLGGGLSILFFGAARKGVRLYMTEGADWPLVVEKGRSITGEQH